MENTYIKSPLNYVGGKYKLLKEIVPLFPEDINTFVDLFGGGFNIGINVKVNKVIYNDINKPITELINYFNNNDTWFIHQEILNTLSNYGLSRSDIYGYEYYGCNSNDGLSSYNKDKYLKLREDYNKTRDCIRFYTLITCSFSNQIRFNSKGNFNMPYGKRDYNKSLQSKLISFIDKLHEINVQIECNKFKDFDFSALSANDFVYADPPYFNSVATYNENDGWTEDNESDLLKILDELNNKGVRFALSNNLKYDNPLLDKWKDKYIVHYINGNYSNCNYQKKDKSKDIEVLITNYTK